MQCELATDSCHMKAFNKHVMFKVMFAKGLHLKCSVTKPFFTLSQPPISSSIISAVLFMFIKLP